MQFCVRINSSSLHKKRVSYKRECSTTVKGKSFARVLYLFSLTLETVLIVFVIITMYNPT